MPGELPVEAVDVAEVRERLDELIERVSRGELRVLITRDGAPLAALAAAGEAERQTAALDGLMDAFHDVPSEDLRAAVAGAVSRLRSSAAPDEPKQGPGLHDALHGPGETLDHSYRRLLEQRTQFRLQIREVERAKQRLMAQAEQLESDSDRLHQMAQSAAYAGREDFAQTIAMRLQTLEQQRSLVGKQIAEFAAKQRQLEEAEQRLSAQLDAFWTQRELVQAQFDVATAEARIGGAAAEFARAALEMAAELDLARFRAAGQNRPASETTAAGHEPTSQDPAN